MSKTQGGQDCPPLSLTPPYRSIKWGERSYSILDQRELPLKKIYLNLPDIPSAANAIKTLAVRGAPLIGVAAALALAHVARKGASAVALNRGIKILASTRPTAVNLFSSLERMSKIIEVADSRDEIVREALRIWDKERCNSVAMADAGQVLIQDGMKVGTYCNTGGLAAPGLGTALGVIIKAHLEGKKIEVVVPETRPLLQGARLTAWELKQWGIPYTLVTESTLASIVSQLDAVFVGADRISSNGDTANKVGTHGFAILARHFKVPFYVVAPTTTFDLNLRRGSEIPVEERDPQEVRRFGVVRTAPSSARVFNPAFDVTPARLISAFVTEQGISRPPFKKV